MDNVDQLWHVAFGVAYRILGMPWQAEDVAQATMEKWHLLSRDKVENPESYVGRMAANISLNTIRGDERLEKKHQKFGLPMPVSTQAQSALDARIDLSYGVSALLLRLPAQMRAVFILRNAFELSFDDIGQALHRSAGACRQAHSRARRLLEEFEHSSSEPFADQAQLERLVDLIQQGKPEVLAQYLARDIAFESDGGETAPAFGQIISGRERIAQFLTVSPVLLGAPLTVNYITSPSGTYFTLSHEGELKLVGLAQFSQGKVVRIFAISDTEKLERSS